MKKVYLLLALIPILAYGGRGWDVGKFYRPKEDKRLETLLSHIDLKKGRSVLGVYGTWMFGDFPAVFHFVYDHAEGDSEIFKWQDTYWLEYGLQYYEWPNLFYEVRELTGRKRTRSRLIRS